MAGPNEAQLTDGSVSGEGAAGAELDRAPLLHPLKQADLGLFSLSVYVEEAADRKESLRRTAE